MRKYYLIDKNLESKLSEMQEQWISQSSNAYTIITADYDISEVFEEEETIYTSVLFQDKQNYIEKSLTFIDLDDALKRASLRFFILELETSEVPSSILNILENTEGVLSFDSSIELRNYLNNLS